MLTNIITKSHYNSIHSAIQIVLQRFSPDATQNVTVTDYVINVIYNRGFNHFAAHSRYYRLTATEFTTYPELVSISILRKISVTILTCIKIQ